MSKTKYLLAFVMMITTKISFGQNAVPATFKTQMQTVLTDYLQLKSALIHQDEKKINAASTELLTDAKTVKSSGLTGDDLNQWNKYSANVILSTQSINQSADVLSQLKSFSEISIPFYNLVKYFKISTQKLYYDYCPMANNGKGAFWLSNNKALVNPYYKGVIMGCEEQKDVF
jgi:hypothetical protein